MKNCYLILVLLFYYYGQCQIIEIPDINFKYKLLQANSGVATNAIGTPITIDINGNDEIEISEALNVYRLFIAYANINDLTGIEHFSNLILLQCANNNLSNIEIIYQLTNLTGLNCSQNNLTYLNVSTLTQLKNLHCYENQISVLDFNNNPQLEVVYCSNNYLTSLDFSNNPAFFDLGCKNNPNLTTIKINNGTTQLFAPQTWINECWTGLPDLNYICADESEIPALQSYLTGCGVSTSGITINSNCALGNEEFANNELVIFPNPATSNVNINHNSTIKTVAIYDFQGRLLQTTNVNANQTTLDVSSYSNGVYFVKIESENTSQIIKLIKK